MRQAFLLVVTAAITLTRAVAQSPAAPGAPAQRIVHTDPAAYRPYKKGVYHTFNWRGWYDFGTGALGDMACHTANLPFRAAKLGYPNLVELLDHSELNPDTYPKTAKIRFVFPAREGLPALEPT